jgi:2-haloacid dehalogenase
MIRTILWDVDGTLLDFLAAEKAAVQALFREFGLGECTDEMVERYSAINKVYWERLERKEMTKPEILVGRFHDFFAEVGVETSVAPAFNDRYQVRLGDTIVFHDDSYEIVKSLRGRVRQYAVSNGTVVAQMKKLRNSGLGELMDGIFLSEEVGAEKPSSEFFEPVFEQLRPFDKSEILIVGDSLTSDIRGGNNVGIPTCWYNPGHAPRKGNVRIDYEIDNLHQIKEILSGKMTAGQ